MWEAGQAYLREHEGLDQGSPKGVIQTLAQLGKISGTEARLGMAMIDARNLTVHTYSESLADAMYARLERYAQLMQSWLERMQG